LLDAASLNIPFPLGGHGNWNIGFGQLEEVAQIAEAEGVLGAAAELTGKAERVQLFTSTKTLFLKMKEPRTSCTGELPRLCEL